MVGVTAIDEAKGNLGQALQVKGSEYAGGETFLDAISGSGFGKGGVGRGGLAAALGKRLGGQLAQPFSKKGLNELLGGDPSSLSNIYKSMLPMQYGGQGYGSGLQGDYATQYQPIVDQILANLPSNEYYGRR